MNDRLRITNLRLKLDRCSFGAWSDLAERVSEETEGEVLRWAVVELRGATIVVEATVADGPALGPVPYTALESVSPLRAVVNLIPTGIGCEFGGYAGDAGPVTRLLSSVCEILITNPNAVNASDFLGGEGEVWYTEGYVIDALCQGAVTLEESRRNRIGLIIEASDSALVDQAVNVANATRAIHGVDIITVHVTDEAIGTRCVKSASGAYVGQVDRPDELFRACEQVIAEGAQAIAVATDIQDIQEADHARHLVGEVPNPMGGAEAVVSHLVSRVFGVPCAHAPLVNRVPVRVRESIVDPRGAGEAISRSGLACVLLGLASAPRLASRSSASAGRVVSAANLTACIAPASAMGSAPVFAVAELGVPVVAVRENRTILNVDAAGLSLDGVIEVGSYLEAAGLIAALEAGICPAALRRPLASVSVKNSGLQENQRQASARG